MSGGVDSSVAAALIKEQGHEAIGATMRIWSGSAAGKPARACPACYGPEEEQDIRDAAAVAEKLDIPFHVFDLREDFRHKVIGRLAREYPRGRTPNPCIVCNRTLKFTALLERVEAELSIDFMATGHYARVEHGAAGHRLLRARDRRKDQSYFLYSLAQRQLGRAIFPVGDYTKDEVRALARRLGLAVHDKPESQDFAAGGYAAVLDMPPKPGPIVDAAGRRLGEHEGIHLYTVGQRKGVGLAQGHPVYVTAIEAERNTLVVGEEQDLYHCEAALCEVNWIAGAPAASLRASARIRSHGEEGQVTIEPGERGAARVTFDRPQRAIAPGQAMVFYDGEVVLGGGTIDHTWR